MKRYGILLLAVLLCAVGMSLMAESLRQQEKSRYYRLQGMQHELEGKLEESYMLYRHAYEADPTSVEAGYYYGRAQVLLSDSDDTASGMQLIKNFVDKYPAEYADNMIYANLCKLTGKLAEAKRVFRRLLVSYPDNEEVLMSLADTYMRDNNSDSTIFYLDEAMRVSGSEIEYMPYMVGAYMNKGDTIGLYNRIDAKIAAGRSDPYYYLLRWTLTAEGNPTEGLRYLQTADSLYPDNFMVKRSFVTHYSNLGDSVALGKAMYDALLCDDAEPEEKMEIFADYASMVLMDGKATAEADTMIANLLEQYPYSPEMRDFAAQYSAAKDDMDKALEHIEIAVDMEPENMSYRSNFMQYLIAKERYADAVKVYEQAVDYNGDVPYIELMAASAYQMLDSTDKATEMLDGMAAKLLTGSNTTTEKVDPLTYTDNRIKELLTDDGAMMLANVLAEKGNLLFKASQTDKAVEYYEKSLKLDDNNDMHKNNYAYNLAERGMKIERAAELSKTAVENDPNNPIYLDTYAYILFRQGKYEEAEKYIKQALSEAEKSDIASYDYYEHYGDILAMTGRTDEAVEMWRKALELKPGRTIIKNKIKAKKYLDE